MFILVRYRRLWLVALSLTTLFTGCTTLEVASRTVIDIVLGRYTATSAQIATAQQRAHGWWSSVLRGEKPKAQTRFVAVQTLNPTPSQKAAYQRDRAHRSKGQLARAGEEKTWSEPDEVKCLMLFDTTTQQVVGTECYVVGELPKENDLVKFETTVAQFVR
jgi:hypothetical protein